jgi:branched-chain amino acid transport system substrate-binding protein
MDRDIQIMGPDGLMQEQLATDTSAELIEGIYATNITIPASHLDSKEASAFLKSYQTTYSKEPPPYAMSSYEAMKVLLHAIEQAEEPTREAVLAAVTNTGEFSGVFGNWQFNEQGDISITTISGFQIQDGNWSFTQVIQ